jgi:hypothetical protein
MLLRACVWWRRRQAMVYKRRSPISSNCRTRATNVNDDGEVVVRWCAAGMVEAAGQVRSVNGRLHLPAVELHGQGRCRPTVRPELPGAGGTAGAFNNMTSTATRSLRGVSVGHDASRGKAFGPAVQRQFEGSLPVGSANPTA